MKRKHGFRCAIILALLPCLMTITAHAQQASFLKNTMDNSFVKNDFAIREIPRQEMSSLIFSKQDLPLPAFRNGFFPVQGKPALPKLSAVAIPAGSYYRQHWGIFCEWEWQTEKKLKFPVSFRLGSLQYVNHLEGKDR